jgi:hypothetical protein
MYLGKQEAGTGEDVCVVKVSLPPVTLILTTSVKGGGT